MMHYCNSGPLIKPFPGFSAGEWLWKAAVVPCNNSGLLITLVLGSQEVSGWDALL